MSVAAPFWNWTSPVWLIAASVVALYAFTVGGAAGKRALLFACGIALLVLAFVSPIGVLADGYLFSAHMVQHLLLLLAIPLLLINSLPGDRASMWFQRRWWRRLIESSALPVAAWVCGVGAMWLWHVPSLCSAATQNSLLGGARDASLVAAGFAFWWPIYAPDKRGRLDPLSGMVYLFSACLGCTLLGIYITFTTISVCPAFAGPAGRIGILNRLYNLGMTPSVDQQLGGLLMWVPPCLFYVAASLGLLWRWYSPPGGSRQRSFPEAVHVGARS